MYKENLKIKVSDSVYCVSKMYMKKLFLKGYWIGCGAGIICGVFFVLIIT